MTSIIRCPAKSAAVQQRAIAQGPRRARHPLAARQPVRLGHVLGHLAAADRAARQGAAEPRAMGLLECDLVGARRSDRRLPVDPRARRLLGRDPRKIPLHPVRHLSVQRAMAAGAGVPDIHCAVLCVEPAELVAQGTGGGVGGSAGADRRADVGRHRRTNLRVAGPLGRAAGDADPGDIRARLRLSARHRRGAGPPLETSRDTLALRALCRTDPRRSSDQPAVHGERDVSAVHARRRQHR